MKELKFSFFYSDKGIKETTPTKEIDLKELFKIYQSETLFNLTKAVRNSTGETQRILKNKLPFITPYGTFNQRKNDRIEHYNKNLIALDFDYLEAHEIEEIKTISKQSKNIVLCGLSPRGKGLKILALISHDFEIENHSTNIKKNVSKILEILNLDKYKCDHSQFTLSQAFFLSHDPGIILNLNAIATNEILENSKPLKKEITFNSKIQNRNRIENILTGLFNRNIDELLNASPGNRHQKILLNIKAFGFIRAYWQEIENEYFTRLENVIETIYEDRNEKQSALKTLHDIRDKATPQSSDKIEEIISENLEIQRVNKAFITGKEYTGLKDQIEIKFGFVFWYFDKYLIAKKPLFENKLFIKFSGYATAKKIDRLNSFPGVEIIELSSNSVLLNGAFWSGSEKIILTENVFNYAS
jgi:hypothetical protein